MGFGCPGWAAPTRPRVGDGSARGTFLIDGQKTVGMTTENNDQLIDELRDAIMGRVVSPADDGWHTERIAWHLLVPQEPAAIVHVADVEEVHHAIRIAARHGLAVTAQPRGHGAHQIRAVELVGAMAEQYLVLLGAIAPAPELPALIKQPSTASRRGWDPLSATGTDYPVGRQADRADLRALPTGPSPRDQGACRSRPSRPRQPPAVLTGRRPERWRVPATRPAGTLSFCPESAEEDSDDGGEQDRRVNAERVPAPRPPDVSRPPR
ncbi:hypothetical protein EV644_12225 [Kribbella orskensis]|uniref:FAD binding domain-containing protein n=1 Tax=Kribbella orskensis TaxID=2512216 RepID=A0ABY2BCE5_9ACTN|nr:hypothetical protein EV642_12425 [Kribbella sp. VKM Ac-2500]TCO13550.1 hypothetical protein EV644_12225 [Kribbella orskensis]